MRKWARLFLIPALFFVFVDCNVLSPDKLPDIDGSWTLTVEYKDCNCSDGNACPDALLQALNITFPSTRQFRVDFKLEDDESLTATFYEGNTFLFEMHGNLEDTGDFMVSLSIGNGTAFFNGSVEGNSMEGRTEMDYNLTDDVTCHG